MKIEELIKESIYHSPLALLTIKDKEKIELINSYLPFSSGFEIECNQIENVFDVNNFKAIPDIVHIQCDGYEQRYRIPNGIRGFICLYNICEQLKFNSELNPLSGIHYHIDMTHVVKSIQGINFPLVISENKDWILNELDSWEYMGTYNKREVSTGGAVWLRFPTYHKTAEFRCGEMSFDYEHLVKRIIHANDIVRRLTEKLLGVPYSQKGLEEIPDFTDVLEYLSVVDFPVENKLRALRTQLDEIENEKDVDDDEESTQSLEEIQRIINNRIRNGN